MIRLFRQWQAKRWLKANRICVPHGEQWCAKCHAARVAAEREEHEERLRQYEITKNEMLARLATPRGGE